MKKFDYKKFRALFENLYYFQDPIEIDSPMKDVRVDDHNGEDITSCMELSIFPQLKNITSWGENVDLASYFELKDNKKVVGARGVVISGMDWCDPSEPTYYYEFAHLEKKDGAVEEYVRELHLDDVVMRVFSPLETKSAMEERGSAQGKALITDMIGRSIKYNGNSAELNAEEASNLKYRCIVEGKDFEIWKVGFHESAYQLLVIAPDFISELNPEAVIDTYVKGTPVPREIKGLKPMNAEQLSKVNITNLSNWYNKGTVDLDPELTAMVRDAEALLAKKALTEKVYNAALAHRFEEITMGALSQALPQYTPLQIALMAVASMDTEEHATSFGKVFLQKCRQYCPDNLKAADSVLTQAKLRLV